MTVSESTDAEMFASECFMQIQNKQLRSGTGEIPLAQNYFAIFVFFFFFVLEK